MSPTTAALAVTLLATVGLAPWWSAAGAAGRRVRGIGAERGQGDPGDPGDPDDPREPASVDRDAHPRVDVPCLLELVAAAVRSGAGIPRALEAVGAAVGGPDGRALARVSSALRLGADWQTAWQRCPHRLDVLCRALRGAWDDGASPGQALRAAGADLLQSRQAAARTAAARLAVRLVLPLGACYLPAFVLVGLVPVLLALGLDVLSG